MEYVVDLNDYSPEVIKHFFLDIEKKSSIIWNGGGDPTNHVMSDGFYYIGYEHGNLVMASAPHDAKLLTRAQFIEKMAELHPKKKQDIREYCKEHRVWAAMDQNGVYSGEWMKYTEKPSKGDKRWTSPAEAHNYRRNILSTNDFTFPDVPWDKSLIAPDGGMPLMREKKTISVFEVGKWYIRRGDENRGRGQIKGKYSNKEWVVYFPNWTGGHDGRGGEFNQKLPGNHCWWCLEDSLIPVDAPENKNKPVKHFEVGKWYVNVGKNEKVPMVDDKQAALDGNPHKCLKNDIEISADSHWDFAIFSGVNGGSWNWDPADWVEVPAPDETYKPKRNDPIFVWDDGDDDRCPCPVYYVHHVRKNGNVVDFMDGEYCAEGKEWDHYRKFDASLVGVPRRDWDK